MFGIPKCLYDTIEPTQKFILKGLEMERNQDHKIQIFTKKNIRSNNKTIWNKKIEKVEVIDPVEYIRNLLGEEWYIPIKIIETSVGTDNSIWNWWWYIFQATCTIKKLEENEENLYSQNWRIKK